MVFLVRREESNYLLANNSSPWPTPDRTKNVIHVPATPPVSSRIVSYNLASHRQVTGRLVLRGLCPGSPNGARRPHAAGCVAVCLYRAFPTPVPLFCEAADRCWTLVSGASLLAGARNYCQYWRPEKLL